MWQHVSIFVVPSEQPEKKIQEAAMEKIQDERKDVKKIKTRESNSCPLLAGSTSSKLKEKNQVGQQGGLNFVCKKLQITTHFRKHHHFTSTGFASLL